MTLIRPRAETSGGVWTTTTCRPLAAAFDTIVTQSNLAPTYLALGRLEEALRMQRDVYSGYLKHYGNEHRETCLIAENYALTLMDLGRFKEAKRVLRKTLPAAQRVIGANHVVTLKIRWCYAEALYKDDGATLGDLREAVETLEEAESVARRVLGGAHPLVGGIEAVLQEARAALRARETPSPGGSA